MLKALRRVSATDVAYVCFLLTFVALGTFVYSLAAGSPMAGILGAGLVVLTVATVAGFRAGARTRGASNDSGIEIEGANIWERPLRRDQIHRYLQSYRNMQGDVEEKSAAVVVTTEPTGLMNQRAA